MKIDKPQYFGKLLLDRGFRDWFIYTFRLIENRKFIIEDLHHGLFTAFQDILDQKVKRQTINLPPRSAKTTMSIYFLAYSLAYNPKCEFIYTSYSAELLKGISTQCANLLKNPAFQAMYPYLSHTLTSIDSNPIDDFWREYLLATENKEKFTNALITTGSGAKILFSSVGSAITGFGAGCRGAKKFSGSLIIDDGNKPADINSILKRKKVFQYFEQTLLSRLNDSMAAIINVQQRLHIEDLSAFLEKIYNFVVLRCPLIIDGQCQLPSQYTPERIEEIQKSETNFLAQYQQNPIREGGNMFKETMFIELAQNLLPTKFTYRFITADLSYKNKESNDFTVFAYWGVIENGGDKKLYLIDCKRKKINSVDVEAWIKAWILSKISYGFRNIWIEDKGHGIYLNQLFRLQGLPVPNEKLLKDELPRDTDKITRANNIIPFLKTDQPNMIFNSDIDDFAEMKDELLCFSPDGNRHDDFVDNVIDGVKLTFFKKKSSMFDVQ